MSSPLFLQPKTTKAKASSYQLLFKQQVSSPKNAQFQQIYELIKKESQKASKNCFQKNNAKTNELQLPNSNKIHFQNANQRFQDQISKKPILRQKNDDENVETQKRRLRALSSKKFDCVCKKNTSKRGKNFTKNLLQYVKMNECMQSSSKKSTDNSNSSEIEKIKNQNQLIYEFIKNEEKRIKQIQEQINEERKKHESEKQLYQLNIQKLRKKVCNDDEKPMKEINEIRESFLSEGEDESEQFDSLSIDSR